MLDLFAFNKKFINTEIIMGLSPYKSRPDGDHLVIMGPHNAQVNANADRSRGVPEGPYVPASSK